MDQHAPKLRTGQLSDAESHLAVSVGDDSKTEQKQLSPSLHPGKQTSKTHNHSLVLYLRWCVSGVELKVLNCAHFELIDPLTSQPSVREAVLQAIMAMHRS